MNQKTFINGIFISEKVFNDGGSILNVRIPADKVDEIAAQLKAVAVDGWVKLKISRNQKPTVSSKTGKVIATHSIVVDDWKPGTQAPRPQQRAADPHGDGPNEESSRVPF
jgi:hypothetical protein